MSGQAEEGPGCANLTADPANPSGLDGNNIANRLSVWARRLPGAIAIAEPAGPRQAGGARSYAITTFAELDQESDRIARGLLAWGVKPGMRVVMLVPFGAQFIRLTFALLKAGLTVVLIDPGMGRSHLVRCLQLAEPDGFMAIPKAQIIRMLLRRRFPKSVWNVTVADWWLLGGKSLRQICALGDQHPDIALPTVSREAAAAIIFTTGSTGPPKGVLYTQATFHGQVDLIRQRYQIQAGTRDLACFPLFGLFDNVMGVTTIIPDMDPTRPAEVNPQRLHEAVSQWEIDQAFGSPALWHRVVTWSQQTGKHFPTLRRVLSAGAPVPASMLQRLRQIIHPEAEVFTPYGATEALPLASIESRQVIAETGPAAAKGRGVCVGGRFDSLRWQVIAIDDGPLRSMDQVQVLPNGKIGELMVAGPVVTTTYAVRSDQDAVHKVQDGQIIWHRMGDVGYLDDQDQFWFCGRKAHRVTQGKKTWFTIPCEAVFNQHPVVYRCALVGLGEPGKQEPVIIVEPHADQRPKDREARAALVAELRDLASRNPLTRRITDIRVYPRSLPVDIRHNSKIFRERLRNQLDRIERLEV